MVTLKRGYLLLPLTLRYTMEPKRMVSLLKGTFIQSHLQYDVQQMTPKTLIARSYVSFCPASVLLMDSVLLMREDEIAASRLG